MALTKIDTSSRNTVGINKSLDHATLDYFDATHYHQHLKAEVAD